MRNLSDEQRIGIEKLSKYKVGALFMEPGCGKTLTAYNLIKSVPDINYILYLAPLRTIKTENYIESVKAEIDKCGGFGVEHDFIGIESFSNSDRLYIELRNKLQNKNPFIVCDESLKIKNMDAVRTKRIIELGKYAQYKLILNGTPLSRNILDLYPQLEFLSSKILKMPYTQFKSIFCSHTTVKKRFNGRTLTREWITGYHNIDYLYSVIKHYIYETDLKLNLKKHYFEYKYELDNLSVSRYSEFKNKILDLDYLLFRNNNIFLEMVNKLQNSYCCTSDKFEVLNTILKNQDKDKVLIFCKFRKSAKALSEKYPSIQILSYGKHCYGLNKQRFNVMIFWDKTFDYALRLQAEHRIFRTGQESNCKFYDLTGNIGLEKLFDENIGAKSNMLEHFKMLTKEQLKELL